MCIIEFSGYQQLEIIKPKSVSYINPRNKRCFTYIEAHSHLFDNELLFSKRFCKLIQICFTYTNVNVLFWVFLQKMANPVIVSGNQGGLGKRAFGHVPLGWWVGRLLEGCIDIPMSGILIQ